MPITISGSGTITGINAGGLPDDCITTADIAANAVTYAKLGTTEQGQLCKAWVNFNGTGVVAIRASYNVSSITDNGVGLYTVNLTSALVDANGAIVITTSAANMPVQWFTVGTITTSNFAMTMGYSNTGTSAAGWDPSTVCASVFR